MLDIRHDYWPVDNLPIPYVIHCCFKIIIIIKKVLENTKSRTVTTLVLKSRKEKKLYLRQLIFQMGTSCYLYTLYLINYSTNRDCVAKCFLSRQLFKEQELRSQTIKNETEHPTLNSSLLRRVECKIRTGCVRSSGSLWSPFWTTWTATETN